jgi:hypothetical protein
MVSGLVMALSVAMSPGQCTTCGPGGGMAFSPGMASGSWVAGSGGGYNPYDAVAAGGGGGGDQLYPLDSPEPWLHGYFQEMPAYSGYSSFRPHNYKHVLAQMQTASRWGIPANMPSSHQWYHQYRQRAGMHPSWDTNLTGTGGGAGYQNYAVAQSPQILQASAQPQYPQPRSQYVPRQDPQSLEQAAAIARGYPGTPIPGISTPNYQRSAVDYRSMPTPTQQNNERFTALQNQLEQQTFQLQAMQQQLESQQRYREALSSFNSQAWGQPNHSQFDGNSQSSSMQPPGSFVAPQSAMPAQSAMMSPPQGLGQSMPPYSSQQNSGQQFSNGVPAQGMAPAAGPQSGSPQMAPGGSYYSPQPLMTVPQNSGYVMPQGVPQTSTMMSAPGLAPAAQPVFPQQGYPQNWSNGVTPAGQAYAEMQQYGRPANYGPQPSSRYGSSMGGNMAPSQMPQPQYAPQQMAPRPMYSAQPIPTGMQGQYPSQYGQ